MNPFQQRGPRVRALNLQKMREVIFEFENGYTERIQWPNLEEEVVNNEIKKTLKDSHGQSVLNPYDYVMYGTGASQEGKLNPDDWKDDYNSWTSEEGNAHISETGKCTGWKMRFYGNNW